MYGQGPVFINKPLKSNHVEPFSLNVEFRSDYPKKEIGRVILLNWNRYFSKLCISCHWLFLPWAKLLQNCMIFLGIIWKIVIIFCKGVNSLTKETRTAPHSRVLALKFCQWELAHTKNV